MSHIHYTGPSTDRVCFVLEPFAGHDSERTRENNLVHDEIIMPAVSAHGFRLTRSGGLVRPNYVTREHQRFSEEANLVVANLTHCDPVVCYCLAWRLARLPDARVLLLLRHDHERLIEPPVLPQPPVLYDISAPRATDVNYDEEAKAEAVRQKLLLARDDLTRQAKYVVDMIQAAAQRPVEPPPASAAGPAAEPAPAQPANTGVVVDEILRQLMTRLQERGDIHDELTKTLIKFR